MENAGVPYDAGTVPPGHRGYWLNFDGAELTVHSSDGRVTDTFDAVSGEPGSSASDQANVWVGPIPEGTYEFESSDFLVGGPAGAFAAFADWGSHAVPVTPAGGTETFGRSGFHIHGGVERRSGVGASMSGPALKLSMTPLRTSKARSM